jgi:hypothetical protein
VKADLVEEVRSLKARTGDPLRTIGSLSVVKALLEAGLVETGVLDGRLVALEYRPANANRRAERR